MANVKITELTAATALAATDVLPIVDVGADATKKVSVSDLLRNLPDGTAASPSLAFADDQNTGVLSPGNNSLAFATSGTQRLVINSSGRVGIGVSSPSQKLDVGGGSIKTTAGLFFGSTASYLYESANDTVSLRIGSDGPYLRFKDVGSNVAELGNASGELALTSGGTEKVRIKNNGNVGIGTSSVDERLHVEGSGSNERVKIENTTSNIAGLVMLNTSRRYDVQVNGSALQVYDNTGSSERLRIDSSGRVGIGVTSPEQLLHVQSAASPTVYIKSTTATAGTFSQLEFGTGGSGTSAKSRIKSYRMATTNASTNLAFETTNSSSTTSERLRITSTGDVLIGHNTSGMATPLSVAVTGLTLIGENAGSANAGVLRVFDKGSANNAFCGIELRNKNSGDIRIMNVDKNSTNNADMAFAVDTGGGGVVEAMRIDSSKRLLVGTTSVTHGTVNLDGSFYLSDLGSNSYGLKIFEESDTVAASGTSSDFFNNRHGGGLCQITVQKTGSYTNQVTALYFVVGKGMGGSPVMTQVVGFTSGQGGVTTPTINTSTGKFTITNNDSSEVRIVIHYFFNRMR